MSESHHPHPNHNPEFHGHEMMIDPGANMAAAAPSTVASHETLFQVQHQDASHHQTHALQSTSEIYVRPAVEVATEFSVEQCSICSAYYVPATRPIPQPDLNRMICKTLDVTPELSFYKQYVALCVNCTNLLRKYDRLRVELEFTKTQVATYVLESLTQVRVEGGSPLEGLRGQILNRWASGQRDSRKKGKGNESFNASGIDGDLSWATCNNVIRDSPLVTVSSNWIAPPPTSSETQVPQVIPESSSGVRESLPMDNDDDMGHHADDDLVHDQASDNEDNIFDVENKHFVTAELSTETAPSNPPTTTTAVKKNSSTTTPKRKRKKQSKKKKSTSEGVFPLICTTCGRIFTQRVPYNGHIAVCTSDDFVIQKNCSICTEEHNVPWLFETWEDFKSHVEKEHPVVKVEMCSVCHVRFLPHGAKNHNCVHSYRGNVSKEAIFQCDRCTKAYNTRGNLVDHVRRQHKDQQHKCEICGKIYGSPMLLGFHMKRHKSVVSKYQCMECGVCLSTNYGLKEHMKRHTGEQPYSCEVCGKKFTTLSAFRCHKMVHENKKPHVCHICGRGFKLRATCARHINRHQIPETNLTKRCPICPKEIFRKIWLLKKHMEVHHAGTNELEEVLEKYKDVDDTPNDKKNIQMSLHSRGLLQPKPKRRKWDDRVVSSEESDEEDDDETSDENENQDEAIEEEVVETKPDVDGGESGEEESTPASQTPSRQSARLMGKRKTRRTLTVYSRENPDDAIKIVEKT